MIRKTAILISLSISCSTSFVQCFHDDFVTVCKFGVKISQYVQQTNHIHVVQVHGLTLLQFYESLYIITAINWNLLYNRRDLLLVTVVTSNKVPVAHTVNMAVEVSSFDWSLLSRLLAWSSIPLSASASVCSVLSVLFIDMVRGGMYSRGMTYVERLNRSRKTLYRSLCWGKCKIKTTLIIKSKRYGF